jgi:membrane fusion protein (multidrug efflux system)
MTQRAKRLTIGAIALVALAALAIPKLTSSSKAGAAGAGAAGAKQGGKGGGNAGPVAVKAYVVQPSRLDDEIVVTGTISPNEQVDLQSEVPGKIVRIFFREGATVNKGMLLVKINDSELRAQLGRAVARRELASTKEARQRTLREKDAVSQAEYDVALNELKSADADIALIKAQIEKTELRAPFAGTVGLRYVSEGSNIVPATKIASLNNINPVKVDFSVPEKYFNVVRPGSLISFKVQGASGEYNAKVYAVEPKIDRETRTLQVRALCPNSGGRLFPGAFAEIKLVLGRVENALMVPTEAVIPEVQGKKVFIVKNGKAEARKIEVGIRTDRQVQVTSGLAAGDSVITTGILQMKPGAQLKVSTLPTM